MDLTVVPEVVGQRLGLVAPCVEDMNNGLAGTTTTSAGLVDGAVLEVRIVELVGFIARGTP